MMEYWWEIKYMKCGCDFCFMPSTIVARAVHWVGGREGDTNGEDSLTHNHDMNPMPRCYFTNDDSCGTTRICSCNRSEHACASDCDCQSTTHHITTVCNFNFMPSATVEGAIHFLVGDTSGFNIKGQIYIVLTYMTNELHEILVPADVFDNVHEQPEHHRPKEQQRWQHTAVSRYILQLWMLRNYTHGASTRDLCKIVMLDLCFQPAMLDYAIYWLVEGRTQIIEFELDTNILALLRTPVDLPEISSSYPWKMGGLAS
uniref:Uncharacterized protein n=1 Tax=Oryza barthii TaxID=65489 RepID=A0A0D3HB06_9ORYZ